MKNSNKFKSSHISLLFLLIFTLVQSCIPSEELIQTAIAQTKSAYTSTITLTPTSTQTPSNTPKPSSTPTLKPTYTPSPQYLWLNNWRYIENYCEFRVTKAYFATKVVPPNPNYGFYYFYQAKNSGTTLLDTVITLENLQNNSEDINSIVSLNVLYDNKYDYLGAPVVEINNGSDFSDGVFYPVEPLSEIVVHFIAQVPNEVEDSLKPVVIQIKISGKEFRFIMR